MAQSQSERGLLVEELVATLCAAARGPIEGAPFQVGNLVRVVVHNDPFIGLEGTVLYLDYDCGCGQRYPEDPLLGVLFTDGTQEEFWSEELQAVVE